MEGITPKDLVKFGLGAMLIAKEKIEGFVDEAIKKGQMSKDEGKKFLDDLKKEADRREKEFEKRVQKEIKNELEKIGVATKGDIELLRAEIEELKELVRQKK